MLRPREVLHPLFLQRWKEGFMLFEVEVAFIVQPGLVPKQFLQGNGLSLYFLATWRAGGGYKYIARLEHLYNLLTKCCNLPYKWC